MMRIQWQKCETCDGEGTAPFGWWIFKANLTCPACNGAGGKNVEVPTRPAPETSPQGDLDFTKHNGEHKKVLRQEPYPNVAHF